MNVNEKGNLGLIKVIGDLYSKGFTAFKPFDDYNPVDCIALDASGKAFRLQIKYRSPGRGDKYEISASSMVNGKGVDINRDLIDCWAVYLSDIDKVVYMPISIMEGKKVHYITRQRIEELSSIPC
jgi:hypothetical protein